MLKDPAGNLIADANGYQYEYDYENRITKIEDSNSNTIAEYAYDAMGRRIKKTDSVADETIYYYYSTDWQVLIEYDDANNFQRKFIYGNYIDEPLIMDSNSENHYYLHNHLYSTVALTDANGTVLERYEYDVYGKFHVLDPNFSDDADNITDFENAYLFTGRRVDILDSGSLTIQYNRNRYYSYNLARWLTHDPLDYVEGMNLYRYVRSNPVNLADPSGTTKCTYTGKMVSLDHLMPTLEHLYGGFSSTWDIEVSVTKNECDCGYKVKVDKCEGEYEGWYLSPETFAVGEKAKEHEYKHKRYDERAFWWAVEKAKTVGHSCTKKKKAECYKSAIYKFIKAYETYSSVCGALVDCKDYPSGPEKDKRCDAFDRLWDDYQKQFDKTNNKMEKCNKM